VVVVLGEGDVSERCGVYVRKLAHAFARGEPEDGKRAVLRAREQVFAGVVEVET